LAGFLYLFLRSAASVRSEPYVIERAYTQPWTLEIETPAVGGTVILVARPPQDFGSRLFTEVFRRMMESLSGPDRTGVPLVLRGEYEQALAGRFTTQALLDAARSAGLGASAFTPVCVAARRTSEPGRTRQVYFVMFESPAFVEFRARLGRGLDGRPVSGFDPASLSPVLILGSTEPDFDRWLPIAAVADRDCVAPIAVR
jgi:hypothetical protein